MRYLSRYLIFKEGKEYNNRKYILVENMLSNPLKREELYSFLQNSPAMQDILALVPEKTHSYDIYKNGHITLRRNFGQRNTISMDNGKFTYNSRIQDDVKSATFDSLETCLRNLWAFIVSRKNIVKITTNYSREITRKLLADPEKQMFWGERKSFEEIYSESNLLSPEFIKDVSKKLNNAFNIIGLLFEPYIYINSKDTLRGILLENKLGMVIHSIIETLVKNTIGFDTAMFSENAIKIIMLNQRKQDKNGVFYIQPRTEEEAFIQTCWKVSKYFKNVGDKLKSNNKNISAPYIKNFISEYAMLLANIVEEKGIEIINNEEEIYGLIYNSLISSNDSFKLLDILKKDAPTIWSKLGKFGGETIDTGADMGGMGF